MSEGNFKFNNFGSALINRKARHHETTWQLKRRAGFHRLIYAKTARKDRLWAAKVSIRNSKCKTVQKNDHHGIYLKCFYYLKSIILTNKT